LNYHKNCRWFVKRYSITPIGKRTKNWTQRHKKNKKQQYFIIDRCLSMIIRTHENRQCPGGSGLLKDKNAFSFYSHNCIWKSYYYYYYYYYYCRFPFDRNRLYTINVSLYVAWIPFSAVSTVMLIVELCVENITLHIYIQYNYRREYETTTLLRL